MAESKEVKKIVKDEVIKLDKTLNEIRETEKKAEQMISEAHKKAEEIIAKAKEEGSKLGLKKKQEIGLIRDQQLEAKKKGLIVKKQEIMKECDKNCIKLEQKSTKNMQRAIDLVIDTFNERLKGK